VQLRERLKRIAENTARPFDEITQDGTVVYGVLEPETGQKETCAGIFDLRFESDSYLDCGDHFETAWWLLTKYAEELPGNRYVVERYPNGGMIVEVTPL
jgi:pyruvate formate-lyase activating enzyme-like uncharacterized protein